MSFNIHNGRIYPKGVIGEKFEVKKEKVKEKSSSFGDILNEQIKNEDKISFSKHASMRVKERKIEISEGDMERLNNALSKAQKKGCKESVLVYKNSGFITSVKNKKVITVCDLEDGEGIVTNIDSVLFV